MLGMTTSLFGFLVGLESQPATQVEELEITVSEQARKLDRLLAQRNELDAEVRKLREELQQVHEQGFHAGEVVKANDMKNVLVKLHPQAIPVVDDITRCDAKIREPESELWEDDEQSDEFWDARSEISERGDSQSELSDEFWDAKSEISEEPKSEGLFSFTKAAGALAVSATVAAAVICPATLPVVALNGVRVVLATKSIEDAPVTGTIGTVVTLAAECMVPCASSAKYLVQTGKSLHRVKDLSEVAFGAKLLIQTGKSIHRVGPIARYGWSVASYGLQTVTSAASYWTSNSKSDEPPKKR